MAINIGTTRNLAGLAVEGNKMLEVPKGNQAKVDTAAATTLHGLMINEDKQGLEVKVGSSTRFTLLPNSSEVLPPQTVSDGDTITAKAGQTIPIEMGAEGDEVVIVVPATPKQGDRITFYDNNSSFSATTGVKINTKIDGITTDHEFKLLDGYWELVYLGSDRGWTVESSDGRVPVPLPITFTSGGANVETIKGPGFYKQLVPVNEVASPAVKADNLNIGDIVYVIYECVDQNEVFGIAHNIGIISGIQNQVWGRRIGIQYRKSHIGLHVVDHIVQDIEFTDSEAWYQALLDYWRLINGHVVQNINMSDTSYFQNQRIPYFDKLIYAYLVRDGYDGGSISTVTNAGTNSPGRSISRTLKGSGIDVKVINYSNGGNEQGGSKMIFDIGRPYTRRLTDNAINYALPRFTDELTCEISAPNITMTLVNCEYQYNYEDRIIIHIIEGTVPDDNETTLNLGTMVYEDDEDTPGTHSAVKLTGSGIACLRLDRTKMMWKLNWNKKY